MHFLETYCVIIKDWSIEKKKSYGSSFPNHFIFQRLHFLITTQLNSYFGRHTRKTYVALCLQHLEYFYSILGAKACLRCPLSLPWCPWNAPGEIYNFLIGCQRENALVPLPFQKRSIQPWLWIIYRNLCVPLGCRCCTFLRSWMVSGMPKDTWQGSA